MLQYDPDSFFYQGLVEETKYIEELTQELKKKKLINYEKKYQMKNISEWQPDENGSIDVEQALMNMLSMEICASIESNIMREYNNYLRND